MLTKVLKKINFGLGLLGLVILFAIITLHAKKNITDEDTFFHIAAGKYILQHGFPHTDIFSCTVIGKIWINHEWLWQVLLAFFHNHFGGDGIIAIQAFVITTLYLLLFLISYKKERIFFLTALLFLGLFLSPDRPLIRPDMVSLLFILIETVIMWFFLKERWSIYLLFFIQVLWTNIHGFFILGPIVFLIIFFTEHIKRRVPLPFEWNSTGRFTDQEFRNLLKAGFVLFLACLVNPHFINGFLYPVKIMLDASGDASYFYSTIGELHHSIKIHHLFYFKMRIIYKILIALSFFSFILNFRKIDLRVLALWAFFLFFSWVAVRNLIFFMPAAYLTIVFNLSFFRSRGIFQKIIFSGIARIIILMIFQIILIVSMVNYYQKMLTASYFDIELSRIRSSYGQLTALKSPRRALDFLIKNKIEGNFFNELETGHRLIVSNYPRIKVFIDGRTEVYGADFFKMYQKIIDEGDWVLFKENIDKFKITGIFLSSLNKKLPIKLLSHIFDDPEWKIVYFDYDALIFLKDVPQNRDAIDRLTLDLSRWRTTPPNALQLRHTEAFKLYSNRADTLYHLSYSEKASDEAGRALEIKPDHLETILLKAEIESNRKMVGEALSLYKQALQLSPRSLTLMVQVALMHELMDNFDEEINVGRAMIKQAPGDPRGYFILSRTFAQTSRYEGAYSALVKAHGLRLGKEDILIVVDMLNDQKASFWARKACRLAYPDDKDMNETCRLIGMDGQ